MKLLNQILDKINLLLASIAGLWLGFLLVSICYATFSRFAFNNPLSNLIEVSAYGLVFIAFLPAPWLLQHRSHINVDIIVNMLNQRGKNIMNLFTDFAGIVISAVIFYVGLTATISSFTNKIQVMDSMQTPQFLLIISIPIGTFFLALQFLRNLKQDIDALKKREGEQ